MNAISSSPATPSSTAIDSTLSLASTPTASGAALKRQPANPGESTDTVDINPARQAQQMYYTGHTVPQIAFSLELSMQAVDNYLNISKAA